MSRARKAITITVTIVEGEDGELGQLRVAGAGMERTWAMNLSGEENVTKTALSEVESDIAMFYLARSEER